MNRKRLLLVAVVAAAGVAVVLRVERGQRRGAEGGSRTQASESPSPALDLGAPLVPTLPGLERVPIADDLQVPHADAVDLAGLRGRLLESDRTPVAGTRVTLLELEESRLFPPLDAVELLAPGPILEVARAVTGADGVFVLRGASADALHGLGIDLGGPRSGLRLVGASLEPGELTDIGDVVLAPTGRITGRVVDPQGRPVSGARVRAGPIPVWPLEHGFQHLEPDGGFAGLSRSGPLDLVVEFPPWLAVLEARLPLCTTRTDARGEFELGAVPAGPVVVLADSDDAVSTHVGPFTLEPAGVHQLGELRLPSGIELELRVVDADGRGVAKAEVRAGFVPEEIELMFLGRVRTTDAEGRLRVARLPPDFDPIAIARRDPASPWMAGKEQRGVVTIELAPQRELLVDVFGSGGTSLDAPELLLRPGGFEDEAELTAWMLPPLVRVPPKPVPGVPGRWSLGLRSHGNYRVVARATGLAAASAIVELDESSPAPELVLGAKRVVEIEVVDASGEPVPAARLRLQASSWAELASTMSDATGRAQLSIGGPPTTTLRVHHPRFAVFTAPLAELLASGGPIRVVLSAGARLVARVADPALADAPRLLVVEGPRDFPRVGIVPSGGALELRRLSAGSWSWDLFDTVIERDALSLFVDQPRARRRGKFELGEGQIFELWIGPR